MQPSPLCILALSAIMVLVSCTSTYEKKETAGTAASSVHLDPRGRVVIATPADGEYGSRSYRGTGRIVAQKTAAAFSRYAQHVEVDGTTSTNREVLLVTARGNGAAYLIVPNIVHWEPRATEWSGIPSRVSIGMTIVDVRNGIEVRSGLLESKSAMMTLVRPSPEALAERLIDDYVAGLYGAPVLQ